MHPFLVASKFLQQDLWRRLTPHQRRQNCDPNVLTEDSSCLPKDHCRNNDFLVPEYLLVIYMTSLARHGQAVSLYFLTPSCSTPRTYTPRNLIAAAKVDRHKPFSTGPLDSSDLQKAKVMFTNISYGSESKNVQIVSIGLTICTHSNWASSRSWTKGSIAQPLAQRGIKAVKLSSDLNKLS